MITLEDIKAHIENDMGISDLGRRSKAHELPFWRGMYCKIACDHTGHTLRRIGSLVGLKHGAVMHWRDTFEHLFFTRPDVEAQYLITLSQLGAITARHRALKKIEQEAEDVVNSMLV